jgi:hypothetical protein
MASGDVVNTAARLQSAASANGVVADERTYRATRNVIDYRGAASFPAKGKARPLAVWEVVEARSRLGVDVISHERIPLVGRAREFALILDTLARVREEGASQLFTIVGVPGIGKSRLVYELMQAVTGDSRISVTWHQGRSLPYGDGISFWALSEIVKAEAGILETDADEVVRKKLARAVRQVVEDQAESGWVERHLQPLVGLGTRNDVSGERRPSDRSQPLASELSLCQVGPRVWATRHSRAPSSRHCRPHRLPVCSVTARGRPCPRWCSLSVPSEAALRVGPRTCAR